jgi:hypothetical protein
MSEFVRLYKRIEGLYGRVATELDATRAWDRYRKIVGQA